MGKCSAAVRWVILGALLGPCAATTGCHTTCPDAQLCQSPIPRELTKMSLPPYRVEPPDILLLDVMRTVPRPPYRAQPFDVLAIAVTGVEKTEPIGNYYQVTPEGMVNFGPTWGSVRVVDLTVEEMKEAIEDYLSRVKKVTKPDAAVSVVQFQAQQQIRGEHLVRPDGTLSLGTYGSVHVAGMTLTEVRAAIESHLSQYLLNPQISVDVGAYNSKVIFVVFDGGGNGEQVTRLPVTGNDTVLGVMSQVGGLTPFSSKHRIWVARPGPACAPCDQILPVDWEAMVKRGRTETNYQLMPGDRIYVAAQPLVTIETTLNKLFAPVERIFGISLLGEGVVRAFAQPLHSTNGTGSGF